MLEVGVIRKPSGLKGMLLVDFTTNMLSERAVSGSQLWADGQLLTIVLAKPHQKKWLVSFEGVNDRSAAELLAGKTLKAEPLSQPDKMFVHELIGCSLKCQNGKSHGKVTAIVANPASDLMQLDGGQLIPTNFIVALDSDAKIINVDIPAGLIELGDDFDDAEG